MLCVHVRCICQQRIEGVGGICDTPFFRECLERAVTASHPRYPGNGDEAAGPDWTHVAVIT